MKMESQKILLSWRGFFESKGLREDFKIAYLNYISVLLEHNVPIIFDFDHLCLLMGRKKHYMSSIINSSLNHYRKFQIKKRNGGFREINTPYPALLEMQYWIYSNILQKIPINSSAHGFAFKKSIITNSKLHSGQKELLKLDLVDFFTSIKINRIIHVFKHVGYTNEIAFYLASICTYDEYLPQGAPTSPCLSNIVALKLDDRLIKFAKKFGLRYTRYADDLTFSGESIPAKFIEYISDIIHSEGFNVNSAKTRLYKKPGKRIVTGISVLKKEISLPRDYKRQLKLELYFIFKYGFDSHVKKQKIRKSNYLLSLLGKINFWISVEPQNATAIDAKRKLLAIYKAIFNVNDVPLKEK
jgi:RNA-directed DNA polymerase